MPLAIMLYNYYNYIEVIIMLKNRERIGSAIDKELLNKLREYSKETKIPISKLLDEAIEDLLIKRKDRE